MKAFFLLTVLFCFIMASNAAKKKTSTYTSRWDHLNLDEILESNRLLSKYTDCLLDKIKCTPDAQEVKNTLPEALETDCAKCTAKQKEGSEKVLRHFVNKRKDLWDQLAIKYDPTGEYAEKYRDRIDAAKEA